MSLLHPALLYAGLAAIALPILVHWLTRPRPTVFPLSTLRLVREVVRQRRARHRLRDFLVLALRAAAAALLGWTLARPLLGERSPVDLADQADVSRVVVLDVSQSMSAGVGAAQGFERGRARAAQLLAYRPGLRANLVEAGATARAVFERPSANFAALRDELARVAARPERLSVQAALSAAGQMLSGAPRGEGRRRELVVVSDFQRTNWSAADFSAVPADVEIVLESVAPSKPMANLAVVRAGCQGRSAVGREARLEVEVGNYSSAARRVEVDVSIGPSSHRLSGMCPPGETVTLTEEITLPQAGWQYGEARLRADDDSLSADNVRALALEVRPAPAYVLVTREPAGSSSASSFYLERALAPLAARDRAQPQQRVTRIDPARWDDEAIAAAELVVVDHPGKLTAEAVGELALALRRGHALLYVAAEPIDAANLNLLARAAGTAWQLPVEFVPAAGPARRDLALSEVRRNEQPFSVFGDGLSSTLSPLRFAGGLASRRLSTGAADDLVAGYSDRTAALVVSSLGAGTVAVWNADLAASNLPRSGAFVPLVTELVERLLGQSRRETSAIPGEPLAVYLPPSAGAAAGLRVERADGQNVDDAAGRLVEEPLGVMWRSAAAGLPGVYLVKRDAQTVFALAAGLPAEESDLRPLAPEVLRDRLAAGRKAYYRELAATDSDRRDDAWTWLAVACVGCLLVEIFVLRASRT